MNTARKKDDDRRLDGQIERVVFRNEENGYAVLRAKVRGHKELVTVVGTVSSANPGEWLAADGDTVSSGQPIYALESEKSVQEVESPAAGTLRIIAPPGATLRTSAFSQARLLQPFCW